MTGKQGVKSGTESTHVFKWMYGCALFLLPVCTQWLLKIVTTTQTEELMTDKQGVKSGTESTNVFK